MDARNQLLEFKRADQTVQVGLCLGQTVLPENPVLIQQEMSTEEWERGASLQNERVRNAFLLGRRCAKKALGLLEPTVESKSVSIISAYSGTPIFQGLMRPYEVSISHSLDFAVAVVSPGIHPVTVDMERVRSDRMEAIQRMLTPAELKMVEETSDPNSTCSLLWTAKEALSKWLRSGMSIHFKVLEVKSIQTNRDRVSGVFAHVFHLRFESWRVGDWWVTVVFPNKSEFQGINSQVLRLLGNP